jgi:glycosyltransferase involved in cell wall biosynthesis
LDADRPALTVIVPCYRRPQQLRRLLGELCDQDVEAGTFEVIIVDDGSPEPLEPVARAEAPSPPFRLEFVRRRKGGASGARNTGTAHARGPLLLFLDDDIGVPTDFLRRHLEAHRIVSGGAVSAVFRVKVTGPSSAIGRWYERRAEEWAAAAEAGYSEVAPGTYAVNPQLLSSTNVSISAASYARAGGFDEQFAYPSCEDMELGLRLYLAGIPVYRITTTEPLHLEPRSTLGQLCLRQRRGARETVRLVKRFPDVFAEAELPRNLGPYRRGVDSPWVGLKKLGRQILGSGPAAPAVVRFTEMAAPVLPDGLLGRVLEVVVGAHIQAGWREGLRHHAEVPPHVPS